MAETIKILGQSAPSAGVLTDAYTVPEGTTAVVSRIVATNRSSTATTYRVSVAVAGASDTTKQYIAYDAPLALRPDRIAGPSLGPGDIVRVRATAATCSFNIFGVEMPSLTSVEDYRILGQQAPAATTLTDAYTVAAGSYAIIGRIIVTNQASTSTTYRISVAVNGEADTVKQYIAYDETIAGNDSTYVQLSTRAATLGPGDVVRVFAGSANLSFNIFGFGPASAAVAAPWDFFWYGPPLSMQMTAAA